GRVHPSGRELGDRGKQVVDVAEEVVDRVADRRRHVFVVRLGHWTDERPIDRLVHLEHRSVPRLEGVGLRHRARRGRTTGYRQRAGGKGARATERSCHLVPPCDALSKRNCPMSFSSTTADCVLATRPPSASITVSPPESRPI